MAIGKRLTAAVLASGFLCLVSLPAQTQTSPELATSLEEQLAAQQAKNETLRRRIAALEEVLKTDVCKNPDAAKLLQ